MLSREFGNRQDSVWGSHALIFGSHYIFYLPTPTSSPPTGPQYDNSPLLLPLNHSTELLLSIHWSVPHPKIQSLLMERVRVVAPRGMNGFEQQGFFPREQGNTSNKHMNIQQHLPWVWPSREDQPTSIREPCLKTKIKFKQHERLLIGAWAVEQ